LETKEHLTAHGHVNIKATNKTTFEITKEKNLTPRGDCILVVDSTKGAVDLSQQFKKIACKRNAHIEITIAVNGEAETVKAHGHPDLIVRKSDYVCGRTLAIRADKAACDLSRKLVEKLRNPNQKAEITLIATARTT
jgi:hypothetical protein